MTLCRREEGLATSTREGSVSAKKIKPGGPSLQFWEDVWDGAIKEAENGAPSRLEQLILDPRVPLLQSALIWLADLAAGRASIPRRSPGKTSKVKEHAAFIRQAYKAFLEQNPSVSKTEANEIFGEIYNTSPATIREVIGRRKAFAAQKN